MFNCWWGGFSRAPHKARGGVRSGGTIGWDCRSKFLGSKMVKEHSLSPRQMLLFPDPLVALIPKMQILIFFKFFAFSVVRSPPGHPGGLAGVRSMEPPFWERGGSGGGGGGLSIDGNSGAPGFSVIRVAAAS